MVDADSVCCGLRNSIYRISIVAQGNLKLGAKGNLNENRTNSFEGIGNCSFQRVWIEV